MAVHASRPLPRFDPPGNLFVTWNAQYPGTTDFAVRPPGGPFGAEQAVPAPYRPDEDPVLVGFDAAGNALFLWQSSGILRAAHRAPGPAGTFGPVQTFGNANFHGPAVNAAGNALAIWAVGSDVNVAFRPAGDSATFDVAHAQKLATATSSAAIVYVVLDPDGAAVAIWMHDNKVKQATNAAGSATFGAPTDVDSTNGRLYVASNAAGRAAAVWLDATMAYNSFVRGAIREPGGRSVRRRRSRRRPTSTSLRRRRSIPTATQRRCST